MRSSQCKWGLSRYIVRSRFVVHGAQAVLDASALTFGGPWRRVAYYRSQAPSILSILSSAFIFEHHTVVLVIWRLSRPMPYPVSYGGSQRTGKRPTHSNSCFLYPRHVPRIDPNGRRRSEVYVVQRAGQVYLCRVGERDNIWHNKVPWPANRDRKVWDYSI